jgi:endonuclease/exonuclease/phosphatase family metal-dependent hydrolase
MIKICLVLAITFIAADCFALVTPRGTEDNLDIATWNVREFPQAGQRTVDTLAIMIRDLQLDIIAMEEINDTLAFADLLSQLPGWDGFYSPDITTADSYQKTGLLYRTDQIEILSWEPIFVLGHDWEFPRPPLRITVLAHMPSGDFDFYLIVMHLKAYDDDTSRARRMIAMGVLKEYLDELVPFLPDHDWMVVGDWNDELTDPQEQNIFWDFLQDSTDYTFLTLPLANNPYWASYIFYNSLIDHIMVTHDVLGEYGDSGITETLRLDDEYSNYTNVISDHRPVMARFTDFTTGIDDKPKLPDDIGLTAYPNPFNLSTNIAFSLTKPSQVKLDVYDCLGRLTGTLIDSRYEAGRYSYRYNAAGLSSGVYFLKLTTDDNTRVTKINLIK